MINILIAPRFPIKTSFKAKRLAVKCKAVKWLISEFFLLCINTVAFTRQKFSYKNNYYIWENKIVTIRINFLLSISSDAI